MYIQRVPHPLAHFSRDPYSNAASELLQTSSTIGTTSSAVSQFTSHPTHYVVLAVVLTILFFCLVGCFIARRRICSLLPCTAKCTRGDEERGFAPQMQREGRFTDGFNIVPPWNTRKASGSSRTPTSPSSEGPSTPVECEERGDLGVNSVRIPKDDYTFVPIPIIVHTPTQTHQTTFLTGPDVPDPDFAAPMAHHEHFFDEFPTAPHSSVIRPHGLPLSPVPEESSTMASFSSPYFEVDEETLYGVTSKERLAR